MLQNIKDVVLTNLDQ